MRYSFTADGGGVPGRGTGIDPDTMTEAGVITGAHQLFTGIFIMAGETITGIIAGKVSRGNITGFITEI